jgi:hypothetical protein
MNKIWIQRETTAAFTLVEMMFSLSTGAFVIGALILGSIAIQKSFAATTHYLVGINNESRLLDFASQDLRRAVRVGMIASGTATTLKDFSEFTISEVNVLTINVPDYYASNVPDNSKRSPFKTNRYARATLDSASGYNSDSAAVLKGCVPWTDAVTDGVRPALKFAGASAGTGEIQIRYYRGPRSATDSTLCFFRAEYSAGSNTPNFKREIAERVVDTASTTGLLLSGSNNGTRFQLHSRFVPRYRRANTGTAGADEYVVVTVRNPRLD